MFQQSLGKQLSAVARKMWVMKTPYSYRCTRLNQFCPSFLADAMTQGAFEHYLLEGKSCDHSQEHWQYGGIVLDVMCGEFGEWIRGTFRADRVCIGYFESASKAAWINGSSVDDQVLQVYTEKCELACRLYPQTRWALIQVPRSCLEKHFREVVGNSARWPSLESGGVSLYSGAEGRVDVGVCFDLCTYLLGKGGDLADQGVSMLLAAISRAILGGKRQVSKDEGGRGSQALQKVKLAELYLAAHLAESYSSHEFARAVGLSERSLELQFKKIFGMSPKKWRQYMGLNIAHRRLGNAGVKPGVVAEIAASCGFSHPGRFSAVYREVFGELPLFTKNGERRGHSFSQQESIFKTFMH